MKIGSGFRHKKEVSFFFGKTITAINLLARLS